MFAERVSVRNDLVFYLIRILGLLLSAFGIRHFRTNFSHPLRGAQKARLRWLTLKFFYKRGVFLGAAPPTSAFLLVEAKRTAHKSILVALS